MVEDTLKRLLDAELQAERIVEEAKSKQDEQTRQAVLDARRAEERFDARLPELKASFMDKAEERATQSVGELERRYAERKDELRDMAKEREQEALVAALKLLLDPQS